MKNKIIITKGTPNPGSQAAIRLGCTCPILDNAHGFGYMGMRDMFVYSGDCPVHQIVEKEVDK
jgi:hypothetical protein